MILYHYEDHMRSTDQTLLKTTAEWTEMEKAYKIAHAKFLV